ncbi:hypothetical protein [Sphingomonas sp. TREG-RG-20F-R18-01]|uniref:hypothetical protein n=1 Tax=Sphingomonas sp. TREG-RG-20F-R18-01 TaxID=2914982 RepID=UPI001F58F1F8|nr:hypothetical protein [Sphingomonas sp. TREG-RG-20F-R18-01]
MQHDIADADCLARLQRHIPRLSIALVEQPERCDTLRHRRGAQARIDAPRDIDGHDVLRARIRIQRGFRGFRRRGLGRLGSPVTSARRYERGQGADAQRAPDHASGVQAS